MQRHSSDEGRLGLTPGRGREELRSTVLRPYLARLRSERGEAAVRALIANVGIPRYVLDDDGGWISVAAARRALASIETALGEAEMDHWGSWFVHPEVLGAYVRMLRVCNSPLDAYQYLAGSAVETTRVGSYEVTALARGRIQVVYKPRLDLDTDQGDLRLCRARIAELRSIPLMWGLPEADVQTQTCLANQDGVCTYIVKWHTPSSGNRVALGSLAGALACGAVVLPSGAPLATILATLAGAGLGAGAGALAARLSEERGARVFEKHRIAALERGLDQRGNQRTGNADLIHSILGGKYRILRRVGSGGIGSVYAAEHISLGHEVAIKVLRGAAAADAAEVARLRREAMVQVSLEHPNVVRTLDLDQMPDGSIYVVMELLHGESLAERLRRAGPLLPDHAVPIFVEVCGALEAAHRRGVVHRDLKPGNVFLCSDGQVKVLDFGMSKIASAEKLTEEGYTLGTPEYMSPEQCVGGPVDARSDLYTFGVLMYEALTGGLPFLTRDRRELMQLHQRELPTPMGLRHPELGIPTELDDVVLTCLAKRPDHRPKSADVLARQLSSVPPSL